MSKHEKRVSAGSDEPVLCDFHRRVVRDAEINAQIAQQIYLHRRMSGRTTEELAELSGVPESIVSCLEDIEHPLPTLSLLRRIGKALDCRIEIRLVKQREAGVTS